MLVVCEGDVFSPNQCYPSVSPVMRLRLGAESQRWIWLCHNFYISGVRKETKNELRLWFPRAPPTSTLTHRVFHALPPSGHVTTLFIPTHSIIRGAMNYEWWIVGWCNSLILWALKMHESPTLSIFIIIVINNVCMPLLIVGREAVYP